jgi:hypothetical protein
MKGNVKVNVTETSGSRHQVTKAISVTIGHKPNGVREYDT